jgi:SMI1-KNR4 cell-wall
MNTAGDQEALAQVLPPPVIPVDPPDDNDWVTAERALGLSLPPDFKAFVTRYGSGLIDDFLVVFNPAATLASMRLVPASALYLEGIRQIRGFAPDEVIFPIHPEPGGLLPWGTTGNGDVGYWVTSPSGDPALWSIAVGEARGPEWFTHPGPLTRFLADALDHSIRVSVFPTGWPSEKPIFHPLALPPQQERLVRLLPPPPQPVDVPEPDQRSRLESEIGRSLPSDYWWFLETYGSGSIGGDLAVFTPSSGVEGRQFAAQQERIGGHLRLVNEHRPGEVPFPIWPEPGGLLAWGGTDSGVMCLWLTSHDDADQWPIVIRDAHRSEWFTHRGPMSWFLSDVLDGSEQVSFLPGGAARRRFEPST